MVKKSFFLLVFCVSAFSFERFTNYSSPMKINDFVFQNDTVWVASSGGLFVFNRNNGKGTLLGTSSVIPDPNLTSLCFDQRSNLWVGSYEGYLGKKTVGEKTQIINSYFSSDWNITGLLSYNQYIIVGASKGLSIFNSSKMIAEKNILKIRPFIIPGINSMMIFKDTLFLGLDEGIAKLDISGDKLLKINFYDPSVWIPDTNCVKPVKTFVKISGSVVPYSGPAAYYKNKVIHAVGSDLFWGNKKVTTFPSAITVIKVDNQSVCWIGTEENYFYKFNGTDLINITIPGPTFISVSRVLADNSGNLWALPEGSGNPWWKAINCFEGNTWKYYSPYSIPQIGGMGDGPTCSAITQSKDGRIWIGTWGGQVKCVNPNDGSWSRYCIFAQGYGNGNFFHTTNGSCPDPDWAKSDAIAQDSSGYIWIAVWKNFSGSLICYDPRYEPDPTKQSIPEKAHYRRFFPENTPNYAENITLIFVDVNGNIIEGSDDKRILVFRHNGNPLNDELTILNRFYLEANVLDAVSKEDSIIIVTANKVLKFKPGKDSLAEMEGIGDNVTCVEKENDHVFWFGTAGNGLVRYDLSSDERQTIVKSQGLLSNNIKDLSFDKDKGILWIGTDMGVSKLTIGYSLNTSGDSKNSVVRVYPNPFSCSRNNSVYFENVPSDGIVNIYSLSGNFVTKAIQIRNSVSGSYLSWTPSKSLIPGTYFYNIKAEGFSKTGKLLIVP